MSKSKQKYPTAGQPAKLPRNLLICKMRDGGKTLKELSDIFSVDVSRISRIISVNWNNYVKNKNNK